MLIIVNQVFGQTTGYPYIIQNKNWSNHTETIHFIGDIISPYNVSDPTVIDGTSNVQFLAGHKVSLRPGFSAKATNSSYHFKAAIEKPVQCVLINPDPSTCIDDNGNVHVHKWEKLEIGFTMPDEYQTAIDNFFNHYYGGIQNPDLVHDLNPYADDSIIVKVNLTSPAGHSYIKWGFFMREATWSGNDIYSDFLGSQALIDDINSPYYRYNWRFRFTPDPKTDEESTIVPWQFTITISAPHTLDQSNTALETYTFSGFSFYCDGNLSDNHGYVEINTSTNRFLQFEDGTPYFAMGENIVANHGNMPLNTTEWWRTYKFDHDNFDKAIDEISECGGNSVRLLMFNNVFPLEFQHLGVYDEYKIPFWYCGGNTSITDAGNYQREAKTLDNLFDHCRDKDVYIQLYVEPNSPSGGGGESDNWGNHCYLNTFTGYDPTHSTSYCATYPLDCYSDYSNPPTNLFDPSKFYCDLSNTNIADPATVLYWYARRYKYIFSRWGYSTNLAVIEPFSEFDQNISYRLNVITNNDNSVCSDHWGTWEANPNVPLAIKKWYDIMVPYFKQSVSSGGLGESKRLFLGSYSDWGWGSSDIFTDYSVFQSSGIDLTDVHSYHEGTSGDMDSYKFRFNLYSGKINNITNNNVIHAFGKPSHEGEIGEFGNITWTTVSNNQTTVHNAHVYPLYNNYDVSFHNEIWSSACTGTYGCAYTWFTDLVHRYKYDDPKDAFGVYQHFPHTYSGGLAPLVKNPITGLTENVTTILGTYFHNFLPLSSFISHVNFKNETYVAHDLYSTTDNIESYYIVGQDFMDAFGWVHNINKYWGDAYFYENHNSTYPAFENYYGCEGLPLPTETLKIGGFSPGYTPYYVKFFPTRMGGQTMPTEQTLTADADGILSIDLSNSPLGCDSTNADYAFIISGISMPARKKAPAGKDALNNTNDFLLYPNPSSGKVTIILPALDNGSSVVDIFDITGRKVFSYENPINQIFSLNLSNVSRGVYLVRYKNDQGVKVKRLVIQ